MSDQPQYPQNGEENDEHGTEWDENETQERIIRIPFSEGLKLGCALAIGFLIAYLIIIATVLFFGTTLTSLLGN